jgi:hypothetical protein
MDNKEIEIVEFAGQLCINCDIADCRLNKPNGVCHWNLKCDWGWRSPSCPHSFEQLAVTTNDLWLTDPTTIAMSKVTKCSQCGKDIGGDKTECGVIENGVAFAFCSYDCLEAYNVSQGLEPWGEIKSQAENDNDQ